MAATPFDVTVILRPLAGGPPFTLTLDCDDVANNLATFKENGDQKAFQLPGSVPGGGYVLEDAQASAAGVDTTRLQLVVDTVDKPVRLRSGALAKLDVPASSRVPGGIRLRQGSTLQVKQLA